VDAAFGERLTVAAAPLRAGFALDVPLPRGQPPGGALIFTGRSGAEVEISYERLQTLPLKHRLVGDDNETLEYTIEERTGGPIVGGFAERAREAVFRSYGWGAIALAVAGAASLVLLIPRSRRGACPAPWLGAAVLLLGITAARYLLFVIVHMSLWPGTDARYLYPVVYLLPCACVILICCAARRRA
jgi:hypothetical protein